MSKNSELLGKDYMSGMKTCDYIRKTLHVSKKQLMVNY